MSDDYFYRPLGTDVWATLIFTVIVGGLFCILIKYLNNLCAQQLRTYDALSYILLPFDSICYQGEDHDCAISLRVCSFIFRFLGIFIIQAISSDLASYLSLQILNLPFHNLEEFANNGKYRILIADNPNLFMNSYFADRNDYLGQRIRTGLIAHFKNFKEANKKLCSNEQFALAFFNEGFLNIDCSLVRIPEPVLTYSQIFRCGQENYYTNIINHVFLQAWEFGLTERLSSKMKEYSVGRYLQPEDAHLHPVEINQLIKIFYILWFGCIIAWIFRLCESVIKFITSNFSKKKRDTRKTIVNSQKVIEQ